MKETPQQYTQRLLGYVEGKKPLAVQAATANKLARLIKGVPVSRLRKRPAPDKWSVSEILAHLADTEMVGGFRMRLILGAPGTPIPAFDQDRWVSSGHYDKRNPRQSVEQFVHAERGVETIDRITHMFAGHDRNHLQQIERILAKEK